MNNQSSYKENISIMKKFAKKILSYTVALTAMFGSVATLSACETDNPEVEMVLQYEGKNYTLKYILDRDATPATIAHFFKLVENNYYDGLVPLGQRARSTV